MQKNLLFASFVDPNIEKKRQIWIQKEELTYTELIVQQVLSHYHGILYENGQAFLDIQYKKVWSNSNSICQNILTVNLSASFEKINLGTIHENSVLFAVMFL